MHDHDRIQKFCPQSRDMLILDLDRLSPAEQAVLYNHIMSCEACNAILNDVRINERVRQVLAVERIPDLPFYHLGERSSRQASAFRRFFHPNRLLVLFASIPPIVQIVSSVIITGLLVFFSRQIISPDPGANAAEATALSLAMAGGMVLIRQANHTQNRRNARGRLALSASSTAELPTTHNILLSLNNRHIASHKEEPGRAEHPSLQTPLPKLNVKKHWKFLFVSLIMLLAIGASSLSGLLRPPTPSHPLTNSNDGPAGLSDGSLVLDLNRPDRALKLQAAARLAAKDTPGAIASWQQATQLDTGDAEPLIYLENQRVMISRPSYFTLVVGTIISKDYTSGGRDDLQAAYIAQKEYNEQAEASGRPSLRLLLAISHSDPTSVTQVAQQVVQATLQDPTIKGVMGWPTSVSAYTSINILGGAHIPMLSPTASGDILTGISPYFFRISPTNLYQEQAAATYAKQVLHAKRVAVIYDPGDLYSSSLTDDFTKYFQDRDHDVIAPEKYTIGNSSQLEASIDAALAQRPDLLFVASYASDVRQVLNRLPACTDYCPLVLGGDALYLQGDYPLTPAMANADRLRFTTFSYSDLWQALNRPRPTFFTNYSLSFDPRGQHPGDAYGYNQPEAHTIQAYDAMRTLLYAINIILTEGRTEFKPEDLRNALAMIDSTHQFEGINWEIGFARGDDLSGQVAVMQGSQNGKFLPVWLWTPSGNGISPGNGISLGANTKAAQ